MKNVYHVGDQEEKSNYANVKSPELNIDESIKLQISWWEKIRQQIKPCAIVRKEGITFVKVQGPKSKQ